MAVTYDGLAQALATLLKPVLTPALAGGVVVQKLAVITVELLPFLAITWNDSVEVLDLDFEQTLNTYPFHLAIIDRGDIKDQTDRTQVLGWRKQVFDTLQPLTALAGYPEVWNVEAKPATVFDLELPDYLHQTSKWTVIVQAAESRVHA